MIRRWLFSAAAMLLVLGPAIADTPPSVVTTLTLFAGARDGLYRSGDWGATWRRVEGPSSGVSLANIGAVHAVVATGPQVHIGADAGLFRSDDFGVTWKSLGVDKPVHVLLFGRYAQAEPVFFVGLDKGLLRTDDWGLTFVKTSLDHPVRRLEWPGPALVVVGDDGVHLSLDAGRTFQVAGTGLPSVPILSLALSSYFAVDPVLFVGSAGRGVFHSSDGAKTWKSAGLDGQHVEDLVWLGPNLYAATDRGLFRTEDLGRTWGPLGDGLKDGVRRLLFPLAPSSGAEIFASTGRGILHSTDGGHNWTPSGSTLLDVLSLATFPPPLGTPGAR